MAVDFFYQNSYSPIPTLPPSIGCIGIIRKQDKYLLECRSDSGKWAFVGGRVENDETFEHCLKREVLEETGLIANEIRLWKTFSDPSRVIRYEDGNSRRIITIGYLAQVEDFSQLTTSDESIALDFFSMNQLLEVSIAETHIPIVQAVINFEKSIDEWFVSIK